MRRIHKGIYAVVALLSSGYIVFSGIGGDGGIEDWEPLNLQIAQALGEDEVIATLQQEAQTDSKNIILDASSSSEPVAIKNDGITNSSITDRVAENDLQNVVEVSSNESSPLVATEVPDVASEVGNIHRINVNTAGMVQLKELPGIGEKKAQAILDYRNEKGPFRKISDLMNVKGIGVKMLEKMTPYVEL